MDYVIQMDFEGPGFVAVPNHVADDERLSCEAVGVLVYLARLAGSRSGAIVRVAAVRERFKLGKDKWQRIAGELRAAGALKDGFGRSDDGRQVVRFLRIGWPVAVVKPARKSVPGVSRKTRLTGVEVCEPENPALTAENPAEVGRVSRPLKREHTPADAAAAIRGEAAASAGAAMPGKAVGFDPARARVSASMGQSWRGPDGVWQKASAWPAFEASQDAENKGGHHGKVCG